MKEAKLISLNSSRLSKGKATPPAITRVCKVIRFETSHSFYNLNEFVLHDTGHTLPGFREWIDTLDATDIGCLTSGLYVTTFSRQTAKSAIRPENTHPLRRQYRFIEHGVPDRQACGVGVKTFKVIIERSTLMSIVQKMIMAYAMAPAS